MLRAICPLCLIFSFVTIVGLVGCGKSGPTADPAVVASYRAQLTLADEPDGGQLVSDVRAVLLGVEETAEEHALEESEEHEDGEEAEKHAEEEHEDGAEREEDEHADDDGGDDEDGHEEHGNEDEGDEDGHEEHAEHDEDENESRDHDEHARHEVTEASEIMEVVIVGQVGGLANPWKETQPDFPFAKNKAIFFLADPQAVVANEEAGHNHAPGEECAFCEAHASDHSTMLAMVRFVDEKGDVLRMGVRELFDVKVTDTVVVRGTAQVVEGGMMVVNATGLYIRR